MVSKTGALLERSIIDRVVCSPERLVFEANPDLDPPLKQDRREATVQDGPPLNTIAECPNLTSAEAAELARRKIDAASALKGQCEAARKDFIDVQVEKAVGKGMDRAAARLMAERWVEGNILGPGALLEFDDPNLGVVDVADILKDPDKFDKETLADPIEGVPYGTNCAIVQVRADSLQIYSFAHGGVTYRLRDDGEEKGSEPLPLFPPLPDAKPYPVEALRHTLSRAAKAISNKAQVPYAVAAQSVLAVAALVTCEQADVMLPFGQTRPLALYFATVAATGDRKSSSDNEALWPVRKYEKKLRDEYKDKLEEWRIEHTAWSAQKRKIENAAAEIAERKISLSELGKEPKKPLSPFLIADDPTIEGLLKSWPCSRAALGLFTTEGGSFTGGHGMNDDNRLKTAALLSNMGRCADYAPSRHGRRRHHDPAGSPSGDAYHDPTERGEFFPLKR